MNARTGLLLGLGALGILILISVLISRMGRTSLDEILSSGQPVGLTLSLKSEDQLEHIVQMIVYGKHKRVLFYFLNTEAFYPDEKKAIKYMSPSAADRFKDITEIESSYRVNVDRATLIRILNLIRPQNFFLEENEFLKDARFQYPAGLQHFSGEQMLEFALQRPLKEGEYIGVDRIYRAESLILSLFWRRKEITQEIIKNNLLPIVHELSGAGMSVLELQTLAETIQDDYHASVLEVPLELVPGKSNMLVKEQRAHIIYKTFLEEMRSGRLNDDTFPVAILNGTEEGGLANRVRQALSDRGVQILTVDNLAVKPLLTTVIMDRSGNTFQAGKLLQTLRLEENRVFFRRRVSDVDVSFLLGTDFEIKKIFK